MLSLMGKSLNLPSISPAIPANWANQSTLIVTVIHREQGLRPSKVKIKAHRNAPTTIKKSRLYRWEATWLVFVLFSLELLKLSLILLAKMGLGAMLPDTLCRNELARVKCVAPSLQIMAPWPRHSWERAIEISILWPRTLVTADTLTGPLALQSQASVTSLAQATSGACDTFWRNLTLNMLSSSGSVPSWVSRLRNESEHI